MVESNNAINNTVGASISGVTNTLTVTNPSNTASSAARASISVGGGSSGDSSLNFNISGVTDFEMGIDNNDSDNFKISASTALGTTDTFVMTTAGERTMPLQPAFLAVLQSLDSNVTGDNSTYVYGTNTAFTEIFDQNSDFSTSPCTFTAPVTGRYVFNVNQGIGGLSSTFNAQSSSMVTSNRTYTTFRDNPGASRNPDTNRHQNGMTICTEMDAADTVTWRVRIGGGALTLDLDNNTNCTSVSGFLVC